MTDARPAPWVSLTSGSAFASKATPAPPISENLTQSSTGVIKDSSSSGIGVQPGARPTGPPIEKPHGNPVNQDQPPTPNDRLRRRLFFTDCLALCFSWVALGMLIKGFAPSLLLRASLGALAAVITLLAMYLLGLYRSRICMRRTQELGRIVLAVLAGAVSVDIVRGPHGFNVALVTCALSAVVTLSILRWNYRRWLQNCRSNRMYLRKVVLIGATHDAFELWRTLRCEPSLGYEVTAVVGVGPNSPPIRDLPIARDMSSIPELARLTQANGILVVPNAISTGQLRTAVDYAITNGLHVQVWSGLEGVGTRRLRMTPLSGEAFFYVEPLVVRRWQSAVKRGVDIVGSVFTLLLAAPLMVLTAISVKLEDRGPVFHKQERVGKDGKLFVVYKFRSMVQHSGSEAFDADSLNERDGPLFKSSNDPRVTRVGRYIRGSSIDELPQLWNVLVGSMSLVGPRPALALETAQFDEQLLRRLTVKPGLTGLWQIEARDNPAFNAYRRLDLFYVDNWSLALDLSILVSTPPIVINRAVRSIRLRRAV